MAIYTGKKCISCGEFFGSGDDIVVCPDCGTPYHRACYQKEGRCINTELHKSGISWSESAQSTNETIRCIRCGFENPSDKIFCESCGTPLIRGQETEERPFNGYENRRSDPQGQSTAQFNPFGGAQNTNVQNNANNNTAGTGQGPFGAIPGQMIFDRDSEIDGIKLDDYAKFVRTNPLPFLSNFIRFGKFGRKLSLNIPAFLFPNVYFLFRKMTLVGMILLLINAVLDIPMAIEMLQSGRLNYTYDLGIDTSGKLFSALSSASWYLSLLMQFGAGFAANYIYYRKAKKTISRLRSDPTMTDEQIAQTLPRVGGTSWGAVLFGFLCYSGLLIGGVFVVYKFIIH